MANVKWDNDAVFVPQVSIAPTDNLMGLTAGLVNAKYTFSVIKANIIASAGTVTSVATGSGLTGGPVTTTGTISLASIGNLTVLANVSGNSASPSQTTLTALIDAAIGNTQGNILYRNSSSWVVLAPGTSGQVLSTGGAAANPSWITASTSNPITVVTAATQTMAVNNDYIANRAGGVAFTLPSVSAVGDKIRIIGQVGSWSVVQPNGGSVIKFGTSSSSTGVGGSISSFQTRDCVHLACTTANAEWTVVSNEGNITIA